MAGVRSGQLPQNHHLNMQRSSTVCNIFSTAFRADHGCNTGVVVALSHVSLSHFSLQDCICTTKLAKHVDCGGLPGQIWWPYSRQGERTSCSCSDQPRWQVDTSSTTTSTITTGSGAGSNVGHVVSFDARECLEEVGRELGVPRRSITRERLLCVWRYFLFLSWQMLNPPHRYMRNKMDG